MSELEKNLIKRVTVSEQQKSAKSSRTYRGFSTVDGKNTGFAKYDFDIIKQDRILSRFCKGMCCFHRYQYYDYSPLV